MRRPISRDRSFVLTGLAAALAVATLGLGLAGCPSGDGGNPTSGATVLFFRTYGVDADFPGLRDASDMGLAVAAVPDPTGTTNLGYLVAGSTTVGRADGVDGLVFEVPQDRFDPRRIVLPPVGGRPDWVRSYGGGFDDRVRAVRPLPDGGAVFAGALGLGAGNPAFLVETVRPKRPEGPSDQVAPDVAGTRSGLIGGELRNARFIEFPNGAEAYAVEPLPATGEFVAAGYADRGDANGRDVYVVRLDGALNVLRARTYGGPGADEARALARIPVGPANPLAEGFIVAGTTASFGTGPGDTDIFAIRLDADLNVVWQRRLASQGADLTGGVAVTPEGGFVIAGTRGFDPQDSDVWVIKLDGGGAVQWARVYDTSETERGNAVRVTQGGDIVVAASLQSPRGDVDPWVFRLTDAGHFVWQNTYGTAADDEALAIDEVAGAGGFIVAGYTRGVPSPVRGLVGSADVLLVRISSFGEGCSSRPTQATSQPTSDPFVDVAATAADASGVIGIELGSGSAGFSDVENRLDAFPNLAGPLRLFAFLESCFSFAQEERNRAPIAAFFTTPDQPFVDQQVLFDASESRSRPRGAQITAYEWSFGDEPTAQEPFTSATGSFTTHRYAAPGAYVARLRVTAVIAGAGPGPVLFFTSETSQRIIVRPAAVTLPRRQLVVGIIDVADPNRFSSSVGCVSSSLLAPGQPPAFNCAACFGTPSQVPPCTVSLPLGSRITLVPDANDPGFVFDRWEGIAPADTLNADDTLVVDMSTDRNIHAFFRAAGTPQQFRLDLCVQGMGSVSTSPASTFACANSPMSTFMACSEPCGSACNGCTQMRNANETVPLVATPGQGFQFVRWEGVGPSDTVNGATADVLMNADRSIRAVFAQLRTLDVCLSGPGAGQGQVTSPSHAQFPGPCTARCSTGGACQASFPADELVELTATSSGPAFPFLGWTGLGPDDQDLGDDPATPEVEGRCRVRMNANRMIVANFGG